MTILNELPEPAQMGERTRHIATVLARDSSVSNYEMWRESKALDLELYTAMRDGRTIPISLLYRRRVVRLAIESRGGR